MSEEKDASWLKSFQKHRHDVLNSLQLVQGYLQLERTGAALTSLHKLSRWLHSLSLLQSHLPESAVTLFQVAMTCPHVIVEEWCGSTAIDADSIWSMRVLWQRLEDVATELDVAQVMLKIAANSSERHVPIQIRVLWPKGFVDLVQAREGLESLSSLPGVRIVLDEAKV
ncbi:Spo0B domain-containing protein [Alicyclobacillus sp. SO9]|uniref:Spo0B domain-containing protein n=1 Tax=Alicyclobacillus sp. SO9 TaxID=2665646 RepID=UPI0018E7A0E0|nr:Spo0B domain-containing protein [Alicyclobacillus sp. SO9]